MLPLHQGLTNMVQPAGLKPALNGLEVRCLIQLGYGCISWLASWDLNPEPTGYEPVALTN